jgi:hypothetical protein
MSIAVEIAVDALQMDVSCRQRYENNTDKDGGIDNDAPNHGLWHGPMPERLAYACLSRLSLHAPRCRAFSRSTGGNSDLDSRTSLSWAPWRSCLPKKGQPLPDFKHHRKLLVLGHWDNLWPSLRLVLRDTVGVIHLLFPIAGMLTPILGGLRYRVISISGKTLRL